MYQVRIFFFCFYYPFLVFSTALVLLEGEKIAIISYCHLPLIITYRYKLMENGSGRNVRREKKKHFLACVR